VYAGKRMRQRTPLIASHYQFPAKQLYRFSEERDEFNSVRAPKIIQIKGNAPRQEAVIGTPLRRHTHG